MQHCFQGRGGPDFGGGEANLKGGGGVDFGHLGQNGTSLYKKANFQKKVAPNIFINLSKTQNPARSPFLALSERFETSKHAKPTFICEIWR